MTLDTRVYVQGRIDHKLLFVKCNQLIGAHEGVRFRDRQDEWPKNGADNPWTIGNEPEQGLCAWMMVEYRPGRPLIAEGEHWQYCDPETDECPAPCGHPCWLEVSFDTAYSYSGPDGGCGDLHARIVAELGAWLDERGIPWSWRNEFTGEVHERYDGLTELGGGGAEASAWFRDIVAPAIESGLLRGTP